MFTKKKIAKVSLSMVLLFGLFFSSLALAQDLQTKENVLPMPISASRLNIDVLSWLDGRWIAKRGTQSIDEYWSLQGQSLIGISRTMDGEKSKLVELLLLEKQGEDWMLRLRFFGPAIDKATRGKEEPLQLKMLTADVHHVQFEGVGKEQGVTLVYKLLSPDVLTATLSKARDGMLVFSEEFQFVRSKN